MGCKSARRSQLFFFAFFRSQSTARPASVKGKSTIRQARTATHPILISLASPYPARQMAVVCTANGKSGREQFSEDATYQPIQIPGHPGKVAERLFFIRRSFWELKGLPVRASHSASRIVATSICHKTALPAATGPPKTQIHAVGPGFTVSALLVTSCGPYPVLRRRNFGQ